VGFGLLLILVLLWQHSRDEEAQRVAGQHLLRFRQARLELQAGCQEMLIATKGATQQTASTEIPISGPALKALEEGVWLPRLQVSQPAEAARALGLLGKVRESCVARREENEAGWQARLSELSVCLSDLGHILDRADTELLDELLRLQDLQRNRLQLVFFVCLALLISTPLAFAFAKGRREKTTADLQGSQQGLKDANRLLSDLIEHSSSIISMRDLKGSYLLVNRKWEEVTGIPRDKALKMTILDLFPGPAGHEYHEHDRRVLETGQDLEFEEIFRAAGAERTFVSARFPVRGAAGEITGVCNVATEITERKRAMRELQERLALQEQLARIIATVPGAIYSFLRKADGSLCMPYCSPVMEELWGIRAEELREDFSPAFALVHPDDLPRVRKSIGESAESMTMWHDVFRISHPGRGQRWIEGQSLPQHQPDGSLLWHGFVQDVTERKQVEDRLRESETRVRQVMESLPQLIWTCAAEGPCEYLSPQWVRYTGMSEAQQLGYKWIEQIHPEDREAMFARWSQAISKGNAFEMEFRIRRHDGQYRWFRTLATLLHDDSGGAGKWFGTNTDIDDLKRAEESLRRSEERLNFALSAGRIGAWDVDLGTRTATRSRIHARIFGYEDASSPWSLERFLGHVVDEDREAVRSRIQEGISKGIDWQIECRILRTDGVLRWILLVGSLERRGNSRGDHISGIIQDITDRKQSERELAQNVEELRKRNDELQRWGRATVNRELRMLELKQEVNQLSRQLGAPARYTLASREGSSLEQARSGAEPPQ